MHITNLISQYFGKFAKREFPTVIQKFINATYVRLMGLDMTEFKNARYYKSLNEYTIKNNEYFYKLYKQRLKKYGIDIIFIKL